MRKYAWLFLSIGLTFGLVGCGDSGSGSAGSGGTGGGGTTATVTGTVSAAAVTGNSEPLAGATVKLAGTSNSVTSDVNGDFSITVPVGLVMFLNTADAHWGSLFAENVPPGGLSNLDVEVIPDTLVDGIAGELLTTADTGKGIVAVVFDETTTVGGETASISAASELPFVFDDQDDPVESDTLCGVADCGSEVFFLNTDVAATVTATATNAGSQPCALEFPGASYSVQAKVLTEIDVFCP